MFFLKRKAPTRPDRAAARHQLVVAVREATDQATRSGVHARDIADLLDEAAVEARMRWATTAAVA